MADASVKIEVKPEPDDYDNKPYPNFPPQDSPPETKSTKVAALNTLKPVKRIHGPSRGPIKHASAKHIFHVNRRRLSGILRDLVRAHNWKEASGVLSILMRGIPRERSYAEDDRRNFQVAVEIHKRFRESNYQFVVKKIYETWMAKQEKKKHEISLELALFYLTQGNIEAAKGSMTYLVADRDSCNDPKVNLIYGLVLYEIWYSDLLKGMKEKGFDLSMSSETNGISFNDDSGELETLESSNDHNAVNIEDVVFSSQCASESSVGNGKNVFMGYKSNVPTKQDVFMVHGSHTSRSLDVNSEGVPSPNHHNFDSSIFLAHGLDASLLPVRLKRMSGDIEQIICTYRRLVNETYRDAEKHLRLALCSRQTLSAALLPFIQILLLGDRVEEAIKELENFCDSLNTALPFRLRASLLEVFHRNQTTMISRCYENVLKRDPTCNHSLQALIRMQKTGNYDSMLLLEMIALHLDSVDGNCSVWEEFASCFLKLVAAAVSEFEDRVSTNVFKSQTEVISTRKVPKPLTVGQARNTWKLRCRWWATRHFSLHNAYPSEMKDGDWQLLVSKAACASHLYGPTCEFVISILRSSRKAGRQDQMSFLFSHIQNPMKLQDDLE